MAPDNSFNLCILMEDTYCISVLVIIHTVQTYVEGSVLLNIDSTLTSPRTNVFLVYLQGMLGNSRIQKNVHP